MQTRALRFPGDSDRKKFACNAGDPGSIPGWGRSPGEGHGNPLQYSSLEIPMDGGAFVYYKEFPFYYLFMAASGLHTDFALAVALRLSSCWAQA